MTESPIRIARPNKTPFEALCARIDNPLLRELGPLFHLNENPDFGDFGTLIKAVLASAVAGERLIRPRIGVWQQRIADAQALADAYNALPDTLRLPPIAATGRWKHKLHEDWSNTILEAFLLQVPSAEINDVMAPVKALLWDASLVAMDTKTVDEACHAVCSLSLLSTRAQPFVREVFKPESVYPLPQLIDRLSRFIDGGKGSETQRRHLAAIQRLIEALNGPPNKSTPAPAPTQSKSKGSDRQLDPNPQALAANAWRYGFAPIPIPDGYQLKKVDVSTLGSTDESEPDSPPESTRFVADDEGLVTDEPEPDNDTPDSPHLINSAALGSRYWLRRINSAFPHHHTALREHERRSLIETLSQKVESGDVVASLIAISLATGQFIDAILDWEIGPLGELTVEGMYRRRLPNQSLKRPPVISGPDVRSVGPAINLSLPTLAKAAVGNIARRRNNPADVAKVSEHIAMSCSDVERSATKILQQIENRRAHRISQAQIRYSLPHLLMATHRDANLVYRLTSQPNDDPPVGGWYAFLTGESLEHAYRNAAGTLFR